MDLVLKTSEGVHVDLSRDGRICIEQMSTDTGEFVFVYLTPSQFEEINKWYEHNKPEIYHQWNNGVGNGEG
jgi:hypothetical protein